MKGIFPINGRVSHRPGRRDLFPLHPEGPRAAPVEMPGLGTRMGSALRAARRVAAAAVQGRRVRRADPEVAACLEACRVCPDRRGAACLHCGCILKFKARLATEDCPHPGGSRWPRPGAPNCQTSD